MHRIAWLAMAMLATLALAGCGPTADSLLEEAEAPLHMDGSVELAAGGHDAMRGGYYAPVPAIVWRSYGVDAPFDEVRRYFDTELSDRGWSPGGGSSGTRTTDEHDAEAWHKGDRILRLAHLRNPPTLEPRSFMTYYGVALIGQGIPD
jgi:hypothetical protein